VDEAGEAAGGRHLSEGDHNGDRGLVKGEKTPPTSDKYKPEIVRQMRGPSAWKVTRLDIHGPSEVLRRQLGPLRPTR
jgi:hypothetical protein